MFYIFLSFSAIFYEYTVQFTHNIHPSFFICLERWPIIKYVSGYFLRIHAFNPFSVPVLCLIVRDFSFASNVFYISMQFI